MKIAIVGCGALGSYYGGRLHQANHEVHFLLRSDYDHVKNHGVRVFSPQGDFHFKPQIAKTASHIGHSELIIVSLKTTANHRYSDLISPLIDAQSSLLCLQNGLGNIECLSRIIPIRQLWGGLCFICVHRPSPGVIVHLNYGQIIIGQAQGRRKVKTQIITKLLQDAGIPCKITQHLAHAQWEKLVWNIPFNGLGVAAVAGYDYFDSEKTSLPNRLGSPFNTGQLLAQSHWEKCVKSLMREVIEVAIKQGYLLSHDLADHMIMKTRSMQSYQPSSVIDYQLGRPLEFHSIFDLPLKKAEEANLHTPILKRLCFVLRQIIDRKAADFH